MKTHKKTGTSFLLFALFAVLVLAAGPALAQKQPAAAQPSFVSWQAPADGGTGGYSGTESCVSCHRVRVEQVSKTAHASTEVAGVTVGANCEACHGPGKAHVDAEQEAERTSTKNPEAAKLIYNFEGSPQQNSNRCLTCHGTGQGQQAFANSEHKLQGVSCDQCHSAHLVLPSDPRERVELSTAQAQLVGVPKMGEQNRWLNQSLLRQTQPDLCFTCHRSIEAQFALPNHHRVPEGLMTCADCHNPHGSSLAKPLQRKATAYETCVTCHVDKRGPFVYEHAGVRVEGCAICHTPHGSMTRHLLQRGEVRFLCLSCHVDHGPVSFQQSGQCTRCHVAIHGSNASEFLVK